MEGRRAPYRAFGSELQSGDVIDVWWSPGRAHITELEAYAGPYADNILKGAQIATFALGGPMTIEASALFSVFNRFAQAKADAS